MSIFDFNDSVPKGPESKKPLKLFLGASILFGALTLGSTLAANINLNGGGNVEFGQGVLTTTACDEDGIMVTPFSTFVNESGAGSHKLTSIQLSGIDSSESNCEGKTFRIRAYGDGPDPLDLFSWESGVMDGVTQEYVWTETDRYDFVDITRTDETFLWTSEGTDDDDVIDIDDSDIEQTAFTLNLVSLEQTIRRIPLASASDVKKITVETFAATETVVNYYLGDIGPGGGTVFYVSSSDFTIAEAPCGTGCRYLEMAPNTWAGGTVDPTIKWSSDDVNVLNGTGTAFGTGFSNTRMMLNSNSPYTGDVSEAAFQVNAYRGGGLNDWFLPSLDELVEIRTYALTTSFAGFAPNHYQSSSERVYDPAVTRSWVYSIYDGNPADSYKNELRYTRPIRAF